MSTQSKTTTYSPSHKAYYEESKNNMFTCECGTRIHKQRVYNHETRSQKHKIFMRFKVLKKIIDDIQVK